MRNRRLFVALFLRYPGRMSEMSPMPRSPELMSPRDTGLIVVDVQEKLLRHVPGHQRIVWNIRRLLDGAKILGVKVAATEQYPQGLGPTTSLLAERLDAIASKMTFSCAGCPDIFENLAVDGFHKLLIVGIETHVCVQQTVLDVMANGFRAYLAVDAVGSRFAEDRRVALRRMELAGASLTTTEAVLFEWCEIAGTPEFKRISELVREPLPDVNED